MLESRKRSVDYVYNPTLFPKKKKKTKLKASRIQIFLLDNLRLLKILLRSTFANLMQKFHTIYSIFINYLISIGNLI